MKRTVEERTKVHWKTAIRTPGRPTDGYDEWLEIEQDMTGTDFEGFVATMRIDRDDDGLCWGPITYTPVERKAFRSGGVNRALRTASHGDVSSLAARCLANMGAHAEPWLSLVLSERKRPGRGGNPDLIGATIAQRRVEAQDRWPRNAIRNMAREWAGEGPTEFTSESAVTAKVNKAIANGFLRRDGRRLELTEKASEVLKGDDE